VTNQKHDREATIDRLLAGRATRGSADSAGGPVPPKLVFGGPSEGGCLDADTLAAWADGALDAAALATAEAHAADCARCQAMLSAMAMTAPAGATAAATSWWMPSLRWLVPLTAAAAAVLVWTIVPQRDGQMNVRQVSRSADATPPPSVETPPSSKEFAPVAVAPPASAVSPTPRSELRTLAESKDVSPSRRGSDAEADKKAAATAETTALADATTRNADLSRRSADLSRRSADGAKADGAKAEGATAQGRPDRARAAENAATAPAAAPPPMARTFSFGAPETVIVSSNPASRWRILQGGAVQRSSDGGATWQTQNTGVTETLSGGSSPLPSVCWLVGPQGIVLRTTDGRSWTRVPFPEAVPLASIRATDDQTATVTTADGRQFITEDGGRTWARAPGV
jgi:hypothetical protein